MIREVINRKSVLLIFLLAIYNFCFLGTEYFFDDMMALLMNSAGDYSGYAKCNQRYDRLSGYGIRMEYYFVWWCNYTGYYIKCRRHYLPNPYAYSFGRL